MEHNKELDDLITPVVAINNRAKVERLADRLLHIAKQQDDKTPYSAEWRVKHGFAHGADLVTVNKSQWDVFTLRNAEWEQMNEQLVLLADWLRIHFIQEREQKKFPFDGDGAEQLNVAEVVLRVLKHYLIVRKAVEDHIQEIKETYPMPKPGFFARLFGRGERA